MPAIIALISGIPEPSTSRLTNILNMNVSSRYSYDIETAIIVPTITMTT